ncbi:MAG: hypothetical protein HQM14_11110 [SAR324 cluster bacterium]|nr:hypothetical protein [SAR324 cluster bacterium]
MFDSSSIETAIELSENDPFAEQGVIQQTGERMDSRIIWSVFMKIVKFFILLVVVNVAVFPCFGNELKRVVVLETMTLPIVQQFTDVFLSKFQEMGYTEGKNSELIRMNAQGDPKRAEKLLSDALDEKKPDLVVAVATLASKAAQTVLKVHNIPLLFMSVTDPVGAGLIDSVGEPTGTNITGKAHYVSADIKIELTLRIIGKIAPHRPIRFGYIYSTYPSAISDLRRLEASAKKRKDIEFVPYEIPYHPIPQYTDLLLEKVLTGMQALEGKMDFLWAPRGALGVSPEYSQILIEKASVPLIVGATEESVKQGALFHVTGDPVSQAEDAAIMAKSILEGTPPGAIVPSLPNRIQVAVNLSTALKMKLAVPSDILELAKDRIYH